MFIPLTAPQGSSLKYTDQQVAELEDKLVAVQDTAGPAPKKKPAKLPGS